MPDTGAKTQSSDKTNPLSVSEMTLLYLSAESSPASHSHAAQSQRAEETGVSASRLASEAEKESRFIQK